MLMDTNERHLFLHLQNTPPQEMCMMLFDPVLHVHRLCQHDFHHFIQCPCSCPSHVLPAPLCTRWCSYAYACSSTLFIHTCTHLSMPTIATLAVPWSHHCNHVACTSCPHPQCYALSACLVYVSPSQYPDA